MEDLDYIEQGLNFVTLYNLETVDLSVSEESSNNKNSNESFEKDKVNLDEELTKNSKRFKRQLMNTGI